MTQGKAGSDKVRVGKVMDERVFLRCELVDVSRMITQLWVVYLYSHHVLPTLQHNTLYWHILLLVYDTHCTVLNYSDKQRSRLISKLPFGGSP